MPAPIIDFDAQNIYIPSPDNVSAETRTRIATEAKATSILVQNMAGIANGDVICVGSIGSENSQLVRVVAIGVYGETSYGSAIYNQYGDTVDGVEIGVTPSLKQSFILNSPVYRIEYNQAKVYEDAVLIGTIDLLTADKSRLSHPVVSTKKYTFAYYNTHSAVTGPVSMETDGFNKLLCTSYDLRKYYSDIQKTGVNLIEKMDLARDDIRRELLSNDLDLNDFTVVQKLSMPAALLSAYYVFMELETEEDSLMSEKKKVAYREYSKKLNQVLSTLQDEIKIDTNNFGSVRMGRCN